MTTPRRIDPDSRLAELLAQQAVEGLSPAERAELDALLAREGMTEEEASLEPLVADLAAALTPPEDVRALPPEFMARLRAEGERVVSSGAVPPRKFPTGGTSGASSREGLAWLAAAAALALAAFSWWRPWGRVAGGDLAARVDAQGDVVRVALADWDGPEIAGVTGEAAWSEGGQEGYLRLKNLPRNDPAREQYQLWIVDGRGMGQRISGALFDSAGAPETLIPIEPGIRVQGAAAFAITIEKPGGVWVSDMTRRVVIGARKERGGG